MYCYRQCGTMQPNQASPKLKQHKNTTCTGRGVNRISPDPTVLLGRHARRDGHDERHQSIFSRARRRLVIHQALAERQSLLDVRLGRRHDNHGSHGSNTKANRSSMNARKHYQKGAPTQSFYSSPSIVRAGGYYTGKSSTRFQPRCTYVRLC